LDKEFLAFLLLHSLPNDLKWETFKSSVLNSLPSGTTLDFDDVSERLIADVTRVDGDADEVPNAESALKSKPSKPSKSKSKSKKWCSFHRSTTHDTDECNSLRAKEKEKKSGKDHGKGGRRDKAHRADDASDSDSDSGSTSDSSSSDDDRAHSAKDGKKRARSNNVKVSKALMTRIQAYVGTRSKLSALLQILIDSGASGHM
ncbi:hypothetical protein B0H13DRAFT_1573181, partial [Mycena leptocephala]